MLRKNKISHKPRRTPCGTFYVVGLFLSALYLSTVSMKAVQQYNNGLEIGSTSKNTSDHHHHHHHHQDIAVVSGKTNHSSVSVSDTTATKTETSTSSSSSSLLLFPYEHSAGHPYAGRFSWIFNRHIPPHPKEIGVLRTIFRAENTLWVGDSTARQDYHTLVPMINHKEDNDNDDDNDDDGDGDGDSDGDSDGSDSTINIPIGVLTDLKNKEEYYCPARKHKEFLKDLGQVRGTDDGCYGGNNKSLYQKVASYWWANDGFSLGPSGKIDYAEIRCFQKVIDLFQTQKHTDPPRFSEYTRKEYTLIVVSMGMWELHRPKDCRDPIDVHPNERLVRLLEALKDLSGPDLFVVWKVHGHSLKSTTSVVGPSAEQEEEEGAKLRESEALQETARDWFASERPPHMDVADFGRAIRDRTFGADRVAGDHRSHWGIEGRLVSIDLIAQIVYNKQGRAKQKAEQQQAQQQQQQQQRDDSDSTNDPDHED